MSTITNANTQSMMRVAIATAIGTVVAAATVWGVEKIVKLRRAALEEIEKAPELETIELEDSESEETETEEK